MNIQKCIKCKTTEKKLKLAIDGLNSILYGTIHAVRIKEQAANTLRLLKRSGVEIAEQPKRGDL